VVTEIDFERLRAERRQRLLDAMAHHRLDALILGRPANVAYASGARQLWTAGARAFSPLCVVVGESGTVHLLSTWDEGVPPEVGRENLFGLTWNPARLAGWLASIPGLRGRIGTDGLTPTFAELLPPGLLSAGLLPVVEGRAALSEARTIKTPDEVACMARATVVATAGLTSLTEALVPGMTERELAGVFAERVAGLGVPVLASDSVACATEQQGTVRLRHLATDRPVQRGQLVALTPGVLFAGYEGGLGRTFVAGEPADVTAQHRELADRCRAGVEAVSAACRAGRTAGDLQRAWETTGEPLPPVPLAYGVGLGVEAPIVDGGQGADVVLQAGSVLAVQSWVSREGVGGYFERHLLLIGEGQPTPL
jgi:Xaa-Pro aminopeptidase